MTHFSQPSPSHASEAEPASGVRRGHPQDASPRTDTGRGLTPVLEEHKPGVTGEVLARYHYGGGQGALAIDDLGDASSPRKYYHQDGLGTTTHLSDASTGSTEAEYVVDGWGRPRNLPGLNSIASGHNRKLFTGHEYDEDTNLHYMKARYMDPDTGRFLSSDSYMGNPGSPASLHRYMYGAYGPTRFVDPYGNDFFDVFDVVKQFF